MLKPWVTDACKMGNHCFFMTRFECDALSLPWPALGLLFFHLFSISGAVSATCARKGAPRELAVAEPSAVGGRAVAPKQGK